MIFVAIAAAIGSLELWAVLAGGHAEPALPLLVRVAGPVLLAFSALRHKGNERIAVLLSAFVVFVFLNSRLFGDTMLPSLLIGIGCSVLAAVGMATSPNRVSSRLVAIAISAAAIAYTALTWVFTRS
jgi:hypothetical protein